MTTDEAIRLERRIAARPSDVYAYFVDSARWARWQGSSAEIEPQPGGLVRLTMSDGSTAEGRFQELVPDTRVVFTWGWNGHPTLPPGASTVEIDLMPDGDGTILRLTHRGLPPDARPMHVAGWEHYIPRLAVAATGADPGPDVPGTSQA